MDGPLHIHGTSAPVPTKTIATFPIGTFLENLAVRHDGTLLISNMTGGCIYHLNPHHPDPQSTIQEIHNFNTASPKDDANSQTDSAYGSGYVAEAIVESATTPDLFYTFAGQHGTAGTWAMYSLDLRPFDPSASDPGTTIKVSKIAEIPSAVWLNGATLLPKYNIVLVADSVLGVLYSVDLNTSEVGLWLEDPLLGKVTSRPPWPAVNGVQYFRNQVFATNSDAGIVLRASVDEKTGGFVEGSLAVVAEGLSGDDLAYDSEGNAYIATNPNQTVVKLSGVGVGETVKAGDWEAVVGGVDVKETAGPTAVAFGRTEEDCRSVYVVTTGGLVVAVGGELGSARVVRADVGSVRGEGA